MKTSTIYGYARISTMKQDVNRQITNIKHEYPDAIVISEVFTGIKNIDKRPAWNKLYKNLKPGDTVVFDEVSRMSRNAVEGFPMYMELFDKGVNLIFLKEPHINTSVYRGALSKHIEKINETGNKATDKLLDSIMCALHEYTINLAKEQIELAFEKAQEEVEYLHKRTSEGVKQAQAMGKQVGRAAGAKVETKKAKQCKQDIIKLSRSFKGTNTDTEVIKILGLARNTYYKYKSELMESELE